MKMLRSSISAIDDRPVAAAAAPLLVWYERNKRALPWREDRNPYHIWLSEIMLQQTRVEAVIPYYHRFLAALPTIGKLAAVEEEQLLKLWEGLGYYSRARNLKKAAVLCVEQYGGMLPPTYDELLKLPGFGPYTAAAVASIAFGAPGSRSGRECFARCLTSLRLWRGYHAARSAKDGFYLPSSLYDGEAGRNESGVYGSWGFGLPSKRRTEMYGLSGFFLLRGFFKQAGTAFPS